MRHITTQQTVQYLYIYKTAPYIHANVYARRPNQSSNAKRQQCEVIQIHLNMRARYTGTEGERVYIV